MKFSEGMWLLREGIQIDWMNHVERANITDNAVDLLLAKNQRHRGDTLNSAAISAQISSPREGIIGVRFVHWQVIQDGGVDRGPHYKLQTNSPSLKIQNKEKEQIFCSSGPLDLAVTTATNQLALRFSGPKGKLTGQSFRSIGYIRDQTGSNSRYEDGMFMERQGYMLAGLDIGVGEKLYGLGERFSPFVKNGQSVDIWNEDGGTSSNLAYKNIPFYLSSAGYGVFVNHPGRMSLEVQSERTTRVNISVAGEEIEYFVIYGATPKEILKRYTDLTGQPQLVPAWSYNLWLTTSFTTNYDEQTVTGFLDGFRDRDIPLGVFHFDCFWMKSFQWCDFEFDSDMFPDAAGYLLRLKERGLKISVWINSYVGQASPLFKEGKKHGYFIKRTDGAVWQWDLWQAGMAVVDFTNPEAVQWYSKHLERLMDLGVDSFKTDFGERIPFKNVQYHDGSDPVRMHNYYAFLYNKIVYNVMTNRKGKSQSLLFARSAAPGGQQFPVHWGGDCESTFEAMAESLRGGLSLMLSGYIFWASDIGGFEGTPAPALYKRWVQFGLLSSHSRLHGSSSFRVPWIYGEDCSEVLRACTKRKILLTPYLLQEALEGHINGTPIMRAMFLEFPDDLNTYAIDTQYMFGSNLLVAPVFSEEGRVTFYVPYSDDDSQGKWRSWFDHSKTYEPGRWYTETHGFDTLPILIRPGSITPINLNLKAPEGNALEGLQLLVNGTIASQKDVKIVNPSQADEVLSVVQVTPTPEITEKVNASAEGIKVTQLDSQTRAELPFR
ncbi:Alpha-xylosidase [Talaromyces islandicus]|uniref:alpha-D-xyloside xylohydrolase n=1 Tax=Talaromyces islandicus TaxID=28573 RepID=A0A0U1LZB4_TALIS|nr:Alpha-xylosidase [Talaromyces islandicus]